MNRLITYISGIERLTEEAFSRISSITYTRYINITEEFSLSQALQECDIFWFRLNHKINFKVLEKARCKYLVCAVTGLDHIDLEACKKLNINVVSLKNEQEFLKEVRATAEHSLGLLLALIRKSKQAFNHVDSYLWNRNLFQGEELYRKKIGILGLGRLGEIMAQYAKALGMEVYYYDKVDAIKTGYKKCISIEELISKIDILSIHITYDDSTHFMIDHNILTYIKQPIYIVNTSRGGVVKERDIINFLKIGKIKGYATDVVYKEPEISENELIKYATDHDNVIITPHIGGYTIESIEKTETFVANKLLKLLKANTKI